MTAPLEPTPGVQDADQGTEPISRPAGRLKAAVAGVRARAEGLRDAIEQRRPSNRAIDSIVGAWERDGERGGDLLAGALAYRVFLWILPAALVIVAGLGFLSAADEKSPTEVAKRIGAFGFAAQSVSKAAEQSEQARWWALAIGVPLLYIASVGVAKAFSAAFSLAWGMPVRKLRSKPLGAAAVIGLAIMGMLVIGIEGVLRREIPGLNVAMVAAMIGVFAAFWIGVQLVLPNRAEHWWSLVPGALLFSVGAQAVHVVTVLYVSRKVESTTYGVLGAAAAMLLSLYLLARVAVAGAVLNAEIHDRHALPDLPIPDLPDRLMSRTATRKPLEGSDEPLDPPDPHDPAR